MMSHIECLGDVHRAKRLNPHPAAGTTYSRIVIDAAVKICSCNTGESANGFDSRRTQTIAGTSPAIDTKQPGLDRPAGDSWE